MNLEKVKTVHDVLIECINISTDIDEAALSLAASEYCPSGSQCGDGRSCIECCKHWLESEVNRPEYKPEFCASNVLLEAISGVHSLVSLSDKYNHNCMYFRGYLNGLQYALAVLGAVFNESEVSINDHA